jgi:uncharacterized protein (TIGR03067 family)
MLADLDRLQGKWVPVSGHLRTKPMSAEQLAQMSVIFEGDRVTLTDPNGGGQIPSGTFRINSDRDPKHITLSAPDASETMPGIFEFDGDRLKLAWIDEDYARPTDFSPIDQANHMTVLLERAPLAGHALGVMEGGKTMRSSVRFAEPDKEQWQFKVTDADGKVYFDMDITATRRTTAKAQTVK